MVICNCIVQAGQIPAETEAALRRGLDDLAQRAFGERSQINWIAIPEGSGFTASKPSTSSVVSMRTTAPVEQSRRAELLNELCGIWTRETGCSLDEVVGVIADPLTN